MNYRFLFGADWVPHTNDQDRDCTWICLLKTEDWIGSSKTRKFTSESDNRQVMPVNVAWKCGKWRKQIERREVYSFFETLKELLLHRKYVICAIAKFYFISQFISNFKSQYARRANTHIRIPIHMGYNDCEYNGLHDKNVRSAHLLRKKIAFFVFD